MTIAAAAEDQSQLSRFIDMPSFNEDEGLRSESLMSCYAA
jgi:hypothetical protein